jgi:hypothetical protein
MFVPVDEVQLQWNEPYFFRFRTMGRQGILLRGIVFLVLCALFTAASVSEPQAVKGARSLPEVVILVLLGSAVLTVLLTAPSIQRRVTISRDGISWGNRYPASLLLFFLSAGALCRPEIKRVVLQRPRDRGSRFPYGIMVVELKYADPVLIAVPNDVALENLAQILNDNGVAAALSDWRSGAASGGVVANEPT